MKKINRIGGLKKIGIVGVALGGISAYPAWVPGSFISCFDPFQNIAIQRLQEEIEGEANINKPDYIISPTETPESQPTEEPTPEPTTVSPGCLSVTPQKLPHIHPATIVYGENSTDRNNVYFNAVGNTETADLGTYKFGEICKLTRILEGGMVVVQRVAAPNPEQNLPNLLLKILRDNPEGLNLGLVAGPTHYISRVSDGTGLEADVYGMEYSIDAIGVIPRAEETKVVIGAYLDGQAAQAAALKLLPE